jgi:hypothetical protein
LEQIEKIQRQYQLFRRQAGRVPQDNILLFPLLQGGILKVPEDRVVFGIFFYGLGTHIERSYPGCKKKFVSNLPIIRWARSGPQPIRTRRFDEYREREK